MGFYHHLVYKCHKCGADIDKWYNLRDYAYKFDTGKRRLLFCSWTCYRSFKNERNRQNKHYYLPNETHKV